jgi:hypothetical protein
VYRLVVATATLMRLTHLFAAATLLPSLSTCAARGTEEAVAEDVSEEAVAAEAVSSEASDEGERGMVEFCIALADAAPEIREEFCRNRPQQRQRICFKASNEGRLSWIVYCNIEFSY